MLHEIYVGAKVNLRNELNNKCLHRIKFKLENADSFVGDDYLKQAERASETCWTE